MVILVQKKEVLTNIQYLNKYSINFMRLFLKKKKINKHAITMVSYM